MKSRDSGATLVEVMISSLFLTTALCAVAFAMGQSMTAVYVSQEQLIAKQKAQEALESVVMARNTQQIGFSQVLNVGDGGIFLSGFQPIEDMGVDGIPNTADDASPIESITYPGPDGNLGTSDDIKISLSAYRRRITISPVTLPAPDTSIDPDIRRIDVDVEYTIKGVNKTVRISTMMSRFS